MKTAQGLQTSFETLFLLIAAKQGEQYQQKTIAQLNEVGLDSAAFYKRHYPVVERYYDTFLKHKKESPGAQLLAETEDVLLGAYTGLFWRHPEWFEHIETVPEEEIRAVVNEALCKDSMDFLDAVEMFELSDREKWHAVLLNQKPKQQLLSIVKAVQENIPAYKKARANVSNELSVLLDNFNVNAAAPFRQRLVQLSHHITPGAPTFPTLAFPVAVLVLDGVVFFGLLSDKVTGTDDELSKSELLIGAKALSEKSKIEILRVLKTESLYNLEIAEKVGLTPATVSHHMNNLLTAGFVDVEKRDGTVYYRLLPEGIQRFLHGAGQLLLP